MKYNKKIQFTVIAILLLSLSWWLGQPGLPPPLKIDNPLKIQGSVKGDFSDKMAPQCSWGDIEKIQSKGSVIIGTAYDLGYGVKDVVIQIQRVRDGAVWKDGFWQESVGEVLNAKIDGNSFSLILPMKLEENENYVFRCQAIDGAGNAQTKWTGIVIEGGDIKEQSSV